MEHWAWTSSPEPRDRSHTSGTLCSSHLRRYPGELPTGAILCEPHNNSASSRQPSLNIHHYEALAKSYLASRAWKITA